VTDIQSYSDALYSHKPGETVKVVYLRDGKRIETTVTLGTRGG
jgi:S1-C subfamily serine protease